MGYEWLDVALKNLLDVGQEEVEQALISKGRWPRSLSDTETGLQYLAVWGRSEAGLALMVVLRHNDGMDWYIAGARYLDWQERVELEEWEQGR